MLLIVMNMPNLTRSDSYNRHCILTYNMIYFYLIYFKNNDVNILQNNIVLYNV